MKKAIKDSERRDRARNNNAHENMKRMLSTSSGTSSDTTAVVSGKSDTKRWMADTILPNFVQSGNQVKNKRNTEMVKSKSAIKYDQLNVDDYDSSIVPNVPRPADVGFKFNPDNSCPLRDLPIHISPNLVPSDEMCDPSHIELKCTAEPSNKLWSNNGILLQRPKNIRWQAETKSVSLDRGDKPSFGFKFKLIYEKSKDNCTEMYTIVSEMYTIVSEIDRNGPADGKLHVGDWIRSVNRQPLLSGSEDFTNVSNAINENSVTELVIQRPEGSTDSTASNKEFDVLQTSRAPRVNVDLQVSNRSPRSPRSPMSPHSPRSQHSPRSPHSQVSPHSPLSLGEYITPPDGNRLSGGMSHHASNYDLSVLFDEPVNWQSLRLFLVGSEACKVYQALVCQNASKDGFMRRSFSVEKDKEDNVVWSEPYVKMEADLLSSLLVSSPKSKNTFHMLRTNEDIDLDAKLKATNVEVYVVRNERFFIQCCSSLFTKNSAFIVAFNAKRLLDSMDTEIEKLLQILLAIRCHSVPETCVELWGSLQLQDVEKSTTLQDEIQTLFHTFQLQLIPYGVSMPKYLMFGESERCKQSKDVFQKTMFSLIKKVSSLNYVLGASLLVSEYVHKKMIKDGDILLVQRSFDDVIRRLLWGHCTTDIINNVKDELHVTGQIINGGAIPYSHPSSNLGNYILLDGAFTHIRFLHKYWAENKSSSRSDDDSTFGFVRKSSLMSILRLATKAGNMLPFLEGLGLVYADSPSAAPDSYYLVPFLCRETNTAGPSQGVMIQIAFEELIPQAVFLMLVMYIDNICDVKEISFPQATKCCMNVGKLSLTMWYSRSDNAVNVNVRSQQSISVADVEKWLRGMCSECLPPVLHHTIGKPAKRSHLGVRPQDPANQPHVHEIDVLPNPENDSDIEPDDIEVTTVDEAQSEVETRLNLPVIKLPYRVASKINIGLNVPKPFMNDWRALGGALGFDEEQINYYATDKSPCERMLVEYSQSHNGTVGKLLAALNSEDVDRPDVVQILQAFVNNSP